MQSFKEIWYKICKTYFQVLRKDIDIIMVVGKAGCKDMVEKTQEQHGVYARDKHAVCKRDIGNRGVYHSHVTFPIQNYVEQPTLKCIL